MGVFLRFSEDLTGKAKLIRSWTVTAAGSRGCPLGEIKWWTAWRRYCFFPREDTVYDAIWLTEIAAFCVEQTNLQKEDQAKRRAAR